jgi:tripartite-type tricarboxylate transporter receptor subunit TctC
MLVVNVSSPAKNVQELIALAKARPGKLTYASTGTGGSLHLTMEMFKMQTGINMLHVPYKGSAYTVPELIGGQVDTLFGSMPALLPHVRSGRIRALGVSSAKRSAVAPDVPTIAESGVPGFESSTWVTLAGPAGTARHIVAAINAAVARCVQSPEISGALANQSTDPALMTPEQTAAFLRDEIVKWKKVVVAAGVKGE